jgi:hypothetical protein
MVRRGRHSAAGRSCRSCTRWPTTQDRLLVAGNGPVARWDGATWTNLGTTVFGQSRALAVLPNGDVVVGFGSSSSFF